MAKAFRRASRTINLGADAVRLRGLGLRGLSQGKEESRYGARSLTAVSAIAIFERPRLGAAFFFGLGPCPREATSDLPTSASLIRRSRMWLKLIEAVADCAARSWAVLARYAVGAEPAQVNCGTGHGLILGLYPQRPQIQVSSPIRKIRLPTLTILGDATNLVIFFALIT